MRAENRQIPKDYTFNNIIAEITMASIYKAAPTFSPQASGIDLNPNNNEGFYIDSALTNVHDQGFEIGPNTVPVIPEDIAKAMASRYLEQAYNSTDIDSNTIEANIKHALNHPDEPLQGIPDEGLVYTVDPDNDYANIAKPAPAAPAPTAPEPAPATTTFTFEIQAGESFGDAMAFLQKHGDVTAEQAADLLNNVINKEFANNKNIRDISDLAGYHIAFEKTDDGQTSLTSKGPGGDQMLADIRSLAGNGKDIDFGPSGPTGMG